MKKFLQLVPVLFCAALLLFVLQGCLKDTERQTYTIYVPVYQSLTDVRANMKGSAAQPLVNTGKLNLYGNYIFLNEIGKGIHIIDNSNPSAPRNISFINIPNNYDLAVKGNYLYADSYSDVIVFDISQPTNVKTAGFLNNVIKEKNRYWYPNSTNPDSIQVVVDYIAKDTTVSYREYRRWNNCAGCMQARADMSGHFLASMPSGVGIGGSMARFTIVNDYLYAVSSHELLSMDISNPVAPQLTASSQMGWDIETIYPFQDKLFIGSRTGMFIYSLSNPSSPVQLSRFAHANSCDPVIADDKYAYVTLRSGTACSGFTNQMEIIDVSNLSAPQLVRTVAMTNPHGLAKDGNKLFICDGRDGLKMYDVSKRTSVELLDHIKGIETFDVIAWQGKAIVVTSDGLYQYAYGSGNTLTQLSRLAITKN